MQGKTPERSPQPGNEGDADRTAQTSPSKSLFIVSQT